MRRAPGLDLANQILTCGGFDDVCSKLLPQLSDFFGAGSSCAFEMRRHGRKLHLDRSVQLRMPSGAIAQYDERFVDLDPVCSPAFSGLGPGQGGVVRLSDRCPPKTLLGSEYYNEFLRGVQIRHVLGMMVRPESDPSRIVVLGFHRGHNDTDFEAEIDHAIALSPAFQASVERMCFREQSRLVRDEGLGIWTERARLTTREAEVAREVMRGLRNAEIAERLGVSVSTVENHLRAVFAKTGVRSRAELLAGAPRH